MRSKRVIVELTGRLLHALLVLFLSFLLVRAVWYAFSLLANDLKDVPPGMPQTRVQNSNEDERPSPQDIVSLRYGVNATEDPRTTSC